LAWRIKKLKINVADVPTESVQMEYPMRPASSRVATLWITVLCLLATLFSLNGLASAQPAARAKRKVSRHSNVVRRNSLPPVTTDTWIGGSTGNWSTASNWNNGAIASGDDIVIATTTAATTVDQGYSIGTLTLSKAGDSATIANSVNLQVSGNISNAGTITLDSTSTYTYLSVGANLTLSGAGTLVLGGTAPYDIVEATTTGNVLTNDSTITGQGTIGNTSLVINNAATWTINANVNGSTLLVNPDTAVGSTNAGTLEATNGGTLELTGSSWTNTGGTISAAAGSSVILNGTTITGGTLSTTGTGVIYGLNGTTLVGVTNAGNFNVENAYVTNLSGTITNTGSFTLNSTSTYAYLELAANTTLTGKGTVIMGAGAPYSIIGDNTGTVYTLTNSNNTIEGDGYLGNTQINFVNNGTVNANTSGGTLYIQPISAGTDVNTATMEATNGGILELQGGSFTNTGGTLTAATSSSVILSGTTVTGGTLTTSGTGVTAGVIYGENSTLVGLTNAGNFNVPNGDITYLNGTITNTGTFTLNSTTTYTYLDLVANTTLTGKGTVIMGAGAPYSIIGDNTGTVYTLTNSNNTIEGDGFLGNTQINFVNNATVNANTNGGTLYVQPISLGTDVNTATMEATNGGILELDGGSFTNTGGTITAATSSSVVLFGTTVTGGTLTTSGTGSSAGVIYGENGSTLIGLTNAGNFNVPNGNVVYLSGTINNTGTMTLNSSSTYTYLNLAASTTLTGSGKVIMGAGAQYSIIGAGTSGFTLTNSGNTIEGDGFLGNDQITVNNKSGSIISNVSGQTLQIQSAGAGTTNSGTMESESGGLLTVVGTLTNYTSGTNTLTGGTYIANGSNLTLPLGSSGGITTLSASVTEENGGQILNSNNTNNNALNGLTTITSTGSLTIGGQNFTDTGNFSNAGSLTILGGEVFKIATLSQISGGSLTAGTFVLDANLALTGATQTITTNAAKLTLAGGTIENANSTSALAGLATNTGTLTIGGTSNSVSTSATSFSNTGTMTIDKGDTFNAAKLTQISGTTLSGGTFVLAGNLVLTTSENITTNSSTLTLEGGTIKTGSTNDLANLDDNTKTLTLASSASVTTSPTANFANTGTVDVEKGTKLTVGGTSNSYNQTAGKTTVDGTLAVGSSGGVNVTGGTILGAGTITGNTSVGNASGTAATINVGDTAKAGLLTITGTYKQLATGTITGYINGTTAGTGYSQLKVSGTAALAGTITFTVASSFQSSLTVGETFTVLTASSVSGTFTNSTIAINSNFHFTVSYTATGVVLTVASGAAPSSPAQSSAKASAHPAVSDVRRSNAIRTARTVVGWPTAHSNAIPVRGSELNDLRSWERLPIAVEPVVRPVTAPRVGETISSHIDLPTSDPRMGQSHAIGIQTPLAHWTGTSTNRREPVKILPAMTPRFTR
jgi:hypothetical protein